MKKVLVAGSLNMDLTALVQRFPNSGETVQGFSFEEHIGGKGANQASACVLQNVHTTLWGMVGSDSYGNEITEKVKKLGINSQLTQTQSRTGLAIIEVADKGHNRIVIIPGANATFTVEEALSKQHLIEEHDIIVLQHEIPLDTVQFIASHARKMQKTVILNPAPAVELSDELLKNIDYIIPNEHELSTIAGMPATTDDEIKAAMLHLLTKGVGCVITSLGSRGLCYTENKQINFISAIQVQAVDSTGAGDALIGAFAAYLAKGHSLQEALGYASYGASISVTRFGAFAAAGTEQEIRDISAQLLDTSKK
ncbi:MAG: ribokinase [Brevinema sp.]